MGISRVSLEMVGEEEEEEEEAKGIKAGRICEAAR